ncbi:MAG: hypothetical protein CMO26_23315 [Thiotrichales bacterium]|nr:hypothetical protein [Thiotrichales bacterium]
MADAKRDVNGWVRNPGYEIGFDVIPAAVRVVFGGVDVGESSAARVMYELGHAPVYYLPQQDVDMRFLDSTDLTTYCPYKGHASYWSVRAGGQCRENAIWAYPTPHPQLAHIEGYLGFYWGRMDVWFEDGVQVEGPREIPGRIDTTTQLKAMFPALAAQWHPSRNAGAAPYEFAPYSDELIWWQDDSGREWQARIRDRVLEMSTLRADGDANPYG